MDATGVSAPVHRPYDPAEDLLAWLAEGFERHGDVFGGTAFGQSILATNDPDHAQHVLRRNWRNYRKGFAIKRIALLLGRGLMVSEGELWKTQRKLVQPTLHGHALAEIARQLEAANRGLVGRWERAADRRQRVSVTHDLSGMVLEGVIAAIFGPDADEAFDRFSILSNEAARDLEFAHAFQPLRDLVSRVVARRRTRDVASRDAPRDILGMLMAARDGEGRPAMSDAQLVSEIITLVVAGHETTAITLGWVWRLLSQHPEAEERLHRALDGRGSAPAAGAGDDVVGQVIEETLRLYPPGWLMTRRAIADDRLGELAIGRGTEVYISPYFIQRSPALWRRPDGFDPERFAPARAQERQALAMLPFSAGPRNCIGEAFARMQMRIHLAAVARRLRLAAPEGPPPGLIAGVNLRPAHDFVTTPLRRASVAPARRRA